MLARDSSAVKSTYWSSKAEFSSQHPQWAAFKGCNLRFRGSNILLWLLSSPCLLPQENTQTHKPNISKKWRKQHSAKQQTLHSSGK